MEQKPDISSSGAAKAEADPAYVNLKVKQQVLHSPKQTPLFSDNARCRMVLSPISELSVALNSRRYALVISFVVKSNHLNNSLEFRPHSPLQLIDSFCQRQSLDSRAVR